MRELRGDSPANFFPGNRLCPSRVQIRNAPRDLLLPGAFRVVIDCCVQAVHQRARQIRALFLGQAQRLLHYLGGSFGHGLSIPRLSVSSITLSFERSGSGGWPPLDPMRPPGWPILAILLHARVGLPLASLFSYSSMRQASSGHPFSKGRMQEVSKAKEVLRLGKARSYPN